MEKDLGFCSDDGLNFLRYSGVCRNFPVKWNFLPTSIFRIVLWIDSKTRFCINFCPIPQGGALLAKTLLLFFALIHQGPDGWQCVRSPARVRSGVARRSGPSQA